MHGRKLGTTLGSAARFFAAAACATWIGATPPAWADDETPTPAATEAERPAREVERLPAATADEITVTASRSGEALGEVPASITIVTREQILASGARNLAEAVAGSAGVDAKSYGSSVSALATAPIRGSGSAQVLVLLDGRPLNQADSGLADLSEIAVESVERIEIVRGPASHLWGASALGGVIHVVTRNPAASALHLSASAGSHGEASSRLSAEGGGDGVRYTVAARSEGSRGFRPNSDARSAGASVKLAADIGSAAVVSLLVGTQRTRLGAPGAVPPAAPSPTPAYGSRDASSLLNRQESESDFQDLRFDWRRSSAATLSLRAFQEKSRRSFAAFYDDWFSLSPLRNVTSARIAGQGLQFSASGRVSGRTVAAGHEIRWDRLTHGDVTTDLSSGSDAKAEWTTRAESSGTWAELHDSTLPRTFLHAGGRVDQNATYGTFVSPYGGVVVRPHAASRLHLSVGRAYRPPSFDDLYWPGLGNPDLRPEWADCWEAGAETNLLPFTSVRVNHFRRWTTDLIQWAPDSVGNWKPTNVNRQRLRGEEIEILSQPAPWIDLAVQTTLLRAVQRNAEVRGYDPSTFAPIVVTAERPSAHVPSSLWSASALVRAPGGLRLWLSVRGAGARPGYFVDSTLPPDKSVRTKTMPRSVTADARITIAARAAASLAGLELPGRVTLELHIEARNLSDDRTPQYLGSSLDDRDFPAAPRTLGFGATLGW